MTRLHGDLTITVFIDDITSLTGKQSKPEVNSAHHSVVTDICTLIDWFQRSGVISYVTQSMFAVLRVSGMWFVDPRLCVGVKTCESVF